jgi:hypothetical protein
MAKYLGRWSVSDVRGLSAVRIGPSGTFLRSPIDAVPQRRSRDQEPEEEGEHQDMWGIHAAA